MTMAVPYASASFSYYDKLYRDDITVFLFHYTDPESLEDILNDGLIRPTPEGGQHHDGPAGVYLTTLGPNSGRQRLILNNYRIADASPTKCPDLWDKTSAYIRIPMDDLPKLERVYDDNGSIIYVNKKNIRVKGDYEHGRVPD